MPYNFYGSWVDDDEPMDVGAGGGQAQVDDGRQGPEIITQSSPVSLMIFYCWSFNSFSLV